MIDAERAMQERLSHGLSGRYRIVREAGHGGMATVYEAMDLKHDRRVAMKVLRPEVAAALGKERFLSEIRIAAKLSHPHILPVHESGEVDGVLFYVMPFVDGETLRERIAREGKLTVDDARRITRDVGLALAYAHQQGVIHRDLKPENIMLSGGIAVVADFGIARAISSVGRERLTQTGFSPGTPAYMSPEQATGESEVDERSDVYSLGCVVYEMLAGVPPYDAATLMSMIAKHAVAPVPSLETSRPDVPGAIARSVAVALAKRPAERFASVAEFIDSIEGRRLLPAAPHPVRWRALTIVLAATLLVAVGVGAWLTLGNGPATSSASIPTVAVLPFEHIGPPDEKYLTDGIVDELSSRVGEIGGISVISRASAMQFSVARLRDVAEQLGAQYVVAGTVKTDRSTDGTMSVKVTPRLLRVADGQETWSDEFTGALSAGALVQLQQNIATQVAGRLNVALRPEALAPLEQRLTNNLEAYKAYLQANVSAAQFLERDDQARALELYERAVLLDSTFALAWARLAQVSTTYFSMFDRTPARLQRVMAAVAKANQLRPNDPETQIARGLTSMFVHFNVDSAMKELEAARLRQPNNSRLLWAIGFGQRWKGNFEAAGASFMAASARDPRSHMYLFEAATIPFLYHDFVKTAELMRRARALAPDWMPTIITSASMQFYAGNLAAARDSMKAISRVRDLTIALIGEAQHRLLMEKIATDTMERVLEGLTLGSSPVDTAAFFYAKGRLHARHGRSEAARRDFMAMRNVLLARIAKRPARFVEHLDLAHAAAELGDSALAKVYADSALRVLPYQEALRGSFHLLEVARIFARIGDERVFDILKRCLDNPGPTTPWLLRVDPAFEHLHNDARFRALAQIAP